VTSIIDKRPTNRLIFVTENQPHSRTAPTQPLLICLVSPQSSPVPVRRRTRRSMQAYTNVTASHKNDLKVPVRASKCSNDKRHCLDYHRVSQVFFYRVTFPVSLSCTPSQPECTPSSPVSGPHHQVRSFASYLQLLPNHTTARSLPCICLLLPCCLLSFCLPFAFFFFLPSVCLLFLLTYCLPCNRSGV
jgi:hypothetical protein